MAATTRKDAESFDAKGPSNIEGCWRCGQDLSQFTEEEAYAHLDRCYAKDGAP